MGEERHVSTVGRENAKSKDLYFHRYNLTSIFLNFVLSESPLLLKIASSFPGLVPRACNLLGHTGSCAQEGPVLGWTFCCCHLKILNFGTKGPTFSFCTGPCKFWSWSCPLHIFESYSYLHSDAFNCSYKPGTDRIVVVGERVWKQLGFAVTGAFLSCSLNFLLLTCCQIRKEILSVSFLTYKWK